MRDQKKKKIIEKSSLSIKPRLAFTVKSISRTKFNNKNSNVLRIPLYFESMRERDVVSLG